MRVLPSVGFGLTFRGELLSLAAARACLEIFAREPVAERVQRFGETMRTRFADSARARGITAVLQGFAGRMSFTFAPANGLSATGLRALWVQECVRAGVLTNGMLMPCDAHDDASLDRTQAAFELALSTIERAIAAGTLEPFLDVASSPAFYETGAGA